MQDKVHENLKKVLTDKKGSVTMGKRSQTTDRSFQHAEIYIRRKTAYGYDDQHGMMMCMLFVMFICYLQLF